MQHEYRAGSDKQILAQTGKSLNEWVNILDKFRAFEKPSSEVVIHLYFTYRLQRYKAKALTSYYYSYKKRSSRIFFD